MSVINRAVMVAMALIFGAPFTFFSTVQAADDDRVWQYREAQGLAGVGGKSAGLIFAVPETDDVQVQADCDSGFVRGGKTISLVLAADIGTMKDGEAVKVRFTGGRFKHSVKGIVHGTTLEEGVTGAHVQLSHKNKLWQAMQERDALDYQVPGYQVANLKLRGGASTIQRFVNTCERYAGSSAAATKTSKATFIAKNTNVVKVAGNSRRGKDGINEKEAFESTKELGTIEGWEAFLNAFPTGFRADLARAYVKHLAGSGRATAPPRQQNNATSSSSSTSPSSGGKKMPILDTFEARAGTAPWRTTRYEMDEGNASAKAAAVKGNGVELLFHCDGKRLAGILRESGRNLYPNFDRRMKQGLAAKRSGRSDGDPVPIPFEFSNGRTYSVGAHVMELNGEVSLGRRGDGGGFKANGSMLSDLMSEQFLTISAPPFVANLQLKKSRPALCSVIRSCGAKADSCGAKSKSYTKKKTYKKKKKKKKKKRSCRRSGTSCSSHRQCCGGKCCLNDFEECEGIGGKCDG